MTQLKAFMAGLTIPAVVMPFAYAVLYKVNVGQVQTEPFQFLPLFLPLAFGLWNVLYFATLSNCPMKDKPALRLTLWGAKLGLLVALLGVFVLNLPWYLFGITSDFKYAPLIILPIVYGIVWRYGVGYLNKVLSL